MRDEWLMNRRPKHSEETEFYEFDCEPKFGCSVLYVDILTHSLLFSKVILNFSR